MTADEFSQDFVDILASFLDAQVDFLVVGAHALAAHGHARATGDLDLLVRPSTDNAARVMNALREFGAPLAAHGVSASDFEREGMVYQMGLPPHRIDVLTSVSGVGYDECSVDGPVGILGGHPVRFIGLRAQIKNKLASGRTKDLADAEVLQALASR